MPTSSRVWRSGWWDQKSDTSEWPCPTAAMQTRLYVTGSDSSQCTKSETLSPGNDMSRCFWFQQRPDLEFSLITSFFITHLQSQERLGWTWPTQTWKEFHPVPELWSKHCSPLCLRTATLTLWFWFLQILNRPFQASLLRGRLQTNQRSLPLASCGPCNPGRWRASAATRLSTCMICSLAFSLWLAKKWLSNSQRCPNQPLLPIATNKNTPLLFVLYPPTSVHVLIKSLAVEFKQQLAGCVPIVGGR